MAVLGLDGDKGLRKSTPSPGLGKAFGDDIDFIYHFFQSGLSHCVAVCPFSERSSFWVTDISLSVCFKLSLASLVFLFCPTVVFSVRRNLTLVGPKSPMCPPQLFPYLDFRAWLIFSVLHVDWDLQAAQSPRNSSIFTQLVNYFGDKGRNIIILNGVRHTLPGDTLYHQSPSRDF